MSAAEMETDPVKVVRDVIVNNWDTTIIDLSRIVIKESTELGTVANLQQHDIIVVYQESPILYEYPYVGYTHYDYAVTVRVDVSTTTRERLNKIRRAVFNALQKKRVSPDQNLHYLRLVNSTVLSDKSRGLFREVFTIELRRVATALPQKV